MTTGTSSDASTDASTDAGTHTPALSRRGFLGGSAATGLGIALGGAAGTIAGASPAAAALRTSQGYGPLVDDPAGRLALPEGFRYVVVAQSGSTPLASGGVTPDDPDAAGVFPLGSGSVIVLNHEIGGSERNGVPKTDPSLVYDTGSGARGGTTTITTDAVGNRLSTWTSAAGHLNNCAGGITPWGTWLTCEETESRRNGSSRQKDHGYVFEVDPASAAANAGRSNVPLRFLGRYPHEAVVVDPASGVVYGTEDAGNPNGLFLRWTPPAGYAQGPGALVALAQADATGTAGTLQAMRCRKGGRFVADLAQATTPGTRYQVEWVDVPERDAQTTSVRKQFNGSWTESGTQVTRTDAEDVTRSRKLEGMWWGDDGAYFVASFARTSDGSANEHDGQVWFYDPATETVTLSTIFGVNPDPDVDADNYDGPDNITVSPYGGVILAEDGDGVSHLVGVTAEGKTYPIARNMISDSEFAGPAFSADGSVLYVGIQSPGHVYAITGPWGRPSNAR